MHLSFCTIAISLTVLFFSEIGMNRSALADEVSASCASDARGMNDLSWLDALSDALDSSIGVREPPSPTPSPSWTPIWKLGEPWKPWWLKLEEPPVVEPVDYNLPEKKLTALTKAAHAAAKKCRENKKTKTVLCGIHTSKRRCYSGVKDALFASKLVDVAAVKEKLPGGHWTEVAAVDAHEQGTLAKLGFKNVMDEGYTSINAPLGAVLVYSGGSPSCAGRKPCGHIEIKLEKEYCSDYCKALPADGYIARKLVGIYVKE
jgi:hypothetical protein